jgi:hypothetical protein
MGRALVGVGDEHLHDATGEDDPSIATWIVRDLLVRQPGNESREQIDVALLLRAGSAEPFGHEFDEPVRGFHRGRRWFEAGDRALEEQLMPNRVLARETDEVLHYADQFFASVRKWFARRTQIEQLLLTVEEHQVVEIELRLEVRVQRRLLEVHALGKVAQGNAGEAIAAGQRPRFLDDPGAFGRMTPAAPIGRG